MDWKSMPPDIQKSLEEVLGYLNFSSGSSDPQFLRNLNDLFAWVDQGHPQTKAPRKASRSRPKAKKTKQPSEFSEPTWRRLGRYLQEYLPQLSEQSEAFRDIRQVEAVIRLVFERGLPAYREWHRDLLFHQTEEDLFQPFFIGRVCETVLAEGPPWDEVDRIVSGMLKRLNDFIGYRPVAVLRTGQKMQPYAHEWVRPIPLYVAGAGVAYGKYHDLVETALQMLSQTDEDILEQAGFELALLDELGMDPRPYDFDHPVNRRPNYQFGMWDMHHLDEEGRYRRYVVQHTTLEAIRSRIDEAEPKYQQEYIWEAAAVLAGTILMGSGMTGCRPSTHDSSVTLGTLLQRTADYRDRFYEQCLDRIGGEHGRRLRREAKERRQPLAGARQHLNRQLAQARACQLQHVGTAHILTSLGDFQGAREQIQIIPGLCARMKCELQCRLTAGDLAIRQGQLDQAVSVLPELQDLLHRAIECGALVDPWNILGFAGQFSLFPAVENSIRDQRVDELIGLMSRLFDLGTRVAKEAAATGREDLQHAALQWLAQLADWWDQFATTELSDVESFSGREAWQSAVQVSEALRAWYAAGTAAGNLAFWQPRVSEFRSAKAYALVVDALLEHKDLVAAMALLVHWLSQADQIPLIEGEYSFYILALRWMYRLWQAEEVQTEDQWKLGQKFLDYLDANAGRLGEAYSWELERANSRPHPESSEEEAWDESLENSSEEQELFSAAYEGVSYRDSAQDGFEGSLFEWAAADPEFELAAEGDQIVKHVAFWSLMGWLWKYTVCTSQTLVSDKHRDDVLPGWVNRLNQFQKNVLELLREVFRYEIPPPRATWEAMTEYDRRREIKDNLLERLVMGGVELAEAQWFLLGSLSSPALPETLADWEKAAVQLFRAVLRQDKDRLPGLWSRLAVALLSEPLLYIPIARGGHPVKILKAQKILRLLRQWATIFPKMGQINLTLELISLVREIESRHPVGPGAITEFDRFFQTALEAIVECIVDSAERWTNRKGTPLSKTQREERLVECLDMICRPLMPWWVQHSQAIRLSPAEILNDSDVFDEIRDFIQRYGADWFTQEFMIYGNLHAILLQGIDRYLEALEETEENGRLRFLEACRGPEERQQAIQYLELILETVLEHYGQYIDYNSTTIQSDRGEMLYTLLDFVRLLANHQRMEWTLRPLWTVHEVLVRTGHWKAADQWEDAILHHTAEIATVHLQKFEQLCSKYGMRLATVGDRLAERFRSPLLINRLKALVRPVWEEMRSGKGSRALASLKKELLPLAAQPSGVGWEVPDWLQVLLEEIQTLQTPHRQEVENFDFPLKLSPSTLTFEEIQHQLQRWL